MFTGLTQDLGRVRGLRREGESVHLELETRLCAQLASGDSLAVNGVCLTVTRLEPGLCEVTAIPETLSRTSLGALQVGSRVNLEPALRAGGAMGGHWVQGHVDGMGRVATVVQRGLSREVSIEADPKLLRYVVEKGSITVDGVSLTVASVGEDRFSIALIPHTMGETTLGELRGGERVNVEVDILAKYVERLLAGFIGRRPEGAGAGITEEWLREKGF
jgi:riboflavin synthase